MKKVSVRALRQRTSVKNPHIIVFVHVTSTNRFGNSIGNASRVLEKLASKPETTAKGMTWKLLTPNIKIGKPFHILVTTPGNGGDFILARIHRFDDEYYSRYSASGKVDDLHNGNYLVTFVAHWTGSTSVSITLFYTSQVITFIKSYKKLTYFFSCFYDHEIRSSGVGTFGPARTVLLKNNLTWGECLFDNRPVIMRGEVTCDLSYPRHRWYGKCIKPKGYDCFELQLCIYDDRMPHVRKGVLDMIVNWDNSDRDIPGPSEYVYVKTGQRPAKKKACERTQITRPQGYWANDEWVNTNCTLSCNSQSGFLRCLRKKTMFLIGDSTVRQVYEWISDYLDIYDSYLEETYHRIWPDLNFELKFSFHGLPISSSLSVNLKRIMWISEHLNSIPAKSSATVILTCIHHFIDLSVEEFRFRLNEISNAIRKLLARAPNVKIIFRTANPRNTNSIYINSYKVKWFNEEAIAQLKQIKEVRFLDIWDMFSGSPYSPNVHYPTNAIGEQIKELLSLICPYKCTSKK